MKTKLFLPIILTALLCGCATTQDPAYYQAKADRIATRILVRVLQNNPQPQLRVKLAKAADELDIITAKPTVSINDLIDVANSIPEVSNSKYGLGLELGQFILFDELEKISTTNPERLRADGKGISAAIRRVLNEKQ